MEQGLDERKRAFDASETQEPKRMRPEEILGSADDKKVTTRLLMNRQEFSKIIGKGGATISHIRSTCGASVKGADVDAEHRLVIISGSPRQVLEAFDVVSELMYQAYVQQSGQTEHFVVQCLLEHSKAGRVVGTKGATIQGLKIKSGASQIRMQKDPDEFSGVQLRALSIEGQLSAVRRAHFFLQELFVDPNQMGSSHQGPTGSYGAAASYGDQVHGHYAIQNFSQVVGTPLQLSSLVALGVQAETVRQLSEMKQYLQRQFGLDLSISREVTSSAGASGTPMFSAIASYPAPQPRVPGPDEVTFQVPSNSVGAIIGKGGQMLKDLQSEYGLRIYVEKEVGASTGVRTVVIKAISSSSTTDSGPSPEDRQAMIQCQLRILSMVQDPMLQASGASAATTGSLSS